MNMSHTLINVIDIWDTDEIPFTDISKESITVIKQDMCEFSKFLSTKLDSYRKQGAHINIAMHHHSPNPYFTFLSENKNELTYIEQSDLLEEYMNKNNLTQLIICGAHLFKCISSRSTGYDNMKKIIPNTKIAITLSRALPQDAFEVSTYPSADLVYL